MILQALNDYYDRKAADPESGIAPEGFEHKEIPFIIVLDKNGKLVQVECTRESVGKYLRAKSFLVPQAEKRTRGIKANLLWDNAEYLLGLSKNGMNSDKHEAFLARIKSLNLESDEGVLSVLRFLQNNPISILEADEYFAEIKETNPFMAFRLYTDDCLVNQRKAVVNKIKSSDSVNAECGICLVTGERGMLSKLQPAIKGVRGANSTGGNIVSFNLAAFNSYGKTQGANAPIGEKASFAYTTALNHLLGKDSKQKIQIGDASVVFWSERQSLLENNFAGLFDEPVKDNPDQLVEFVKALYESVKSGALPDLEKKSRFFVLGLSPNAARISIRFWHVGIIADFSQKIVQHFHDLTIEHANYEKDHLSLWQMLLSTAAQEKTDNIVPNIAGEWMRAILMGLPYPDSLYQAVLRRIQVEKKVNYPRAAIVKAYLNRKLRYQSQQEEVTVSLDKENKNVGYRLGRLFATLEKIQEEAHNRNLSATLRDRYYSTASATPNVAFSIMLRSKNHHIGKIEHRGRAVNFEKLIREIMDDIVDFPSHLNLEDQGRFAIGYYHQRQDFFKGSESKAMQQGDNNGN